MQNAWLDEAQPGKKDTEERKQLKIMFKFLEMARKVEEWSQKQN